MSALELMDFYVLIILIWWSQLVRSDNIWIGQELCEKDTSNQLTSIYCLTSLKEPQVFPQLDKYLNHSEAYSSLRFSRKMYTLLPDLSFSGFSINGIFINNNKISTIGDRFFEQVQQLETIQLNQNELSRVKIKNIDTLIEIYLSDNAIELIENDTFYNLSSLTKLNLESNSIRHIDTEAFITLERLRVIELMDNKLSSLTFRSKSLESIDLERNKFKTLTYYEGLESIIELIFSGNQISQIEDSALSKSFPRLEFLYLDDNNLSDRYWSNQTFCGLTNLSRLILESNYLTRVKNEHLSCLKRIRELKLTNNYIEDLGDVDFTQFELNTLDLDSNNLVELPSYFLSGRTSITTIKLDQNSIRKIQRDAFKNITSIIIGLRMTSNRISDIEDYAFSDLRYLQKLYLNNALILNINKFTFVGLVGLTSLRLENNLIEEIKPETFIYLKKLQDLNLGYNNIVNISGEGESFRGLASLLYLDLTGNKIVYLLPGTFQGLVKLKFVYLNKNKLKSIDSSALKGLLSTFVYLQGNNIEFLKDTAFNANMVYINMANNRISSIDRQTFSKLEYVQEIDLTNNNIFSLDWLDSFGPDNQVTTINLGYNVICSVPSFKKLTILTSLDLAHNRIASLPRDTFSGLENLYQLNLSDNFIREIDMSSFSSLSSLMKLDLSNNPVEIVRQAPDSQLPGLYALILSNTSVKLINQVDLSSLSHLDMSWNVYSQNEPFIIPFKSIEIIRLAGLNISASVIGNFSIRLEELDISRTDMEPAKIKQIISQSHNLKRVNFSGLGILNFDSCMDLSVYTKIETIDMSYNRIMSVQKSHLEVNTKLNYLYLSHNAIETIETEAFSRNTNLFIVDLSFNRIMFISQDLFGANKLMGVQGALNLKNNDIQWIELEADSEINSYNLQFEFSENKMEGFPRITGDSVYICLALRLYRNRISELGPNDLANYFSLQSLDISENKLSEIDPVAFKYTNVMLDLNLAFNNISELDQDVFSSMIKLKSLNISGNRLKKFTNKTFRDLVELETLDLSQNRIEQIAFNSFERLKELRYLSLYANSIKNVFDRRVLNGLISLKFLYAPSDAFINITTLAEMIEMFEPSVAKKSSSTDVVYYTSFSILTRYDLTIKPSLSECFDTYYMIRNNIHLNLVNDVYVSHFLSDCDEFVKLMKEAFAKEKRSFRYMLMI